MGIHTQLSKLSELYYIHACTHTHKTLIAFVKNKNGKFYISLLLKNCHSASHHRSLGAQSLSFIVNWFWNFWSKLAVEFPFMHLLKSFFRFPTTVLQKLHSQIVFDTGLFALRFFVRQSLHTTVRILRGAFVQASWAHYQLPWVFLSP